MTWLAQSSATGNENARGTHPASAPMPACPFDSLSDFTYLITSPSQKYYRPDLTYGRGETAKSYSKQRISPFFYVVSIESNIKTSSERQFNSL